MTTDRQERQPVALGTAPGRWLVVVTVLASGMAFLDATAVQVALPSIGRELDASLSGLQWTITSYTLTLASLILLGGSLGDRYGRRRVFVIGVIWFAAASLICGVAQNVEQLIAARALQGVGGALLTPGSLALIQSSFRPVDRARAIGIWSSLAGIAGLIGPFLGGVLVDAVSWRLVFLINVPFAVVIVAVSGRHVPESRDPAHHGRFDYLGAVLGALALGGVTYALIGAGENMLRTDVVVSAVIGLAAGAAFVVRERRAADPMLPPRLFADRQFTGANLATLAVYGALGGSGLFLVLQLQTVLGYDATAAGAALLPTILLITLLSPQGRRPGPADRSAAADDRRAADRRGRHAVAGGRRRQRALRGRDPAGLTAAGPRHGGRRRAADGHRARRRPGRAGRDRQRREQRRGPRRPAAGRRRAPGGGGPVGGRLRRTPSRSPAASGRR